MKRFLTLMVALMMVLALVPAVATAEGEAFVFTGATGYSSSMMTTVGSTSYIKYDITLTSIPAATYLSSAQIVIDYDSTKLTFVDGSSDAWYVNNVGQDKTIPWTVNGDTAGKVEYAIATAECATVKQPIISILFSLKAGVPDGTVIPMTLSAALMTLSIANSEYDPNYVKVAGEWGAAELDPNTKGKKTVMINPQPTVGFVNGSITIGAAPGHLGLNYAALQARYNELKALLPITAVSTTGKDLANGTTYVKDEASKAVFAAAVEAAGKVLDYTTPAANQAAVTAALTALNNAAKNTGAGKAVVSKATLVKALADAEAYKNGGAAILGKKYAECSDDLKAKWDKAIKDATDVIADQQATQNQVDAAVKVLNGLGIKTGESMIVVAFAGIMVLAIAGLAYVVIRRRKFN